jgi:hypothetical protein
MDFIVSYLLKWINLLLPNTYGENTYKGEAPLPFVQRTPLEERAGVRLIPVELALARNSALHIV